MRSTVRTRYLLAAAVIVLATLAAVLTVVGKADPLAPADPPAAEL